jgi:hypothetical protein
VIVVGISPGLRTLTYCVLEFPGMGKNGRKKADPKIRDLELMKGGRVKKAASPGPDELRRKANPHALVLDVVLERAMDESTRLGTTTIMAVGPSANDEEPEDHDRVVRLLLKQMVETLRSAGFRIEHREWQTESELRKVLGADVRRTVNRSFKRATTVLRGPGFIHALAAALAAERVVSDALLLDE